MSFGASPRVTIVYEVSYANFADVNISFAGAANRLKPHCPRPPWRRPQCGPKVATVSSLDASDNVTQSRLLVMNVQQPPWPWLPYAFGIKPFSNNTLRVTYASPGGQKFKLRSVTSC